MKYYAGIGSRQTPPFVLGEMRIIGTSMAQNGYCLRSGGADGADTAFEIGARAGNGPMEIFVPWKGFNKNSPERMFEWSETAIDLNSLPGDIQHEAFEIAKKYHPAWYRLTYGMQQLMARNVLQILGRDLNTPVDQVICWTKDGKASGGTGQAMRIAVDRGIPIHNLYHENEQALF